MVIRPLFPPPRKCDGSSMQTKLFFIRGGRKISFLTLAVFSCSCPWHTTVSLPRSCKPSHGTSFSSSYSIWCGWEPRLGALYFSLVKKAGRQVGGRRRRMFLLSYRLRRYHFHRGLLGESEKATSSVPSRGFSFSWFAKVFHPSNATEHTLLQSYSKKAQ